MIVKCKNQQSLLNVIEKKKMDQSLKHTERIIFLLTKSTIMYKYIFLFLWVASIASCANKDQKPSGGDTAESKPAADGAKIFKQNCELCHGADGKLGLNGSKDLSVSTLDLDARVAMVTKGKGVMMPYENILSADEIKAVAEFTFSLKK